MIDIRVQSTEGIEKSQCMVMVLMAQKHTLVLFIIIIMVISLPSTALGGRLSRNFVEHAAPSGTMTKEHYAVSENRAEEVDDNHAVRWRMLMKVNTKDYGSYDPTPSLSKPPFKLIPN